MKKFTLLLALLMLMLCSTALAADYVPGDTFTIDVSASTEKGVYAEIVLGYDKAVFKLTEVTSSTGTGNPLTDSVSWLDLDNDPLGTVTASFTFEVKEGATNGTYTFSVSDFDCREADPTKFAQLNIAPLSVSKVTVKAVCKEHKFDWINSVVVDATCQADGYEYALCTVCGAESPHLPTGETATDHTQSFVFIDPTCTESGWVIVKCPTCDLEYSRDPIMAMGHEWDDGVIATAPTCRDSGVRRFSCIHKDCTETKNELVAKDPDAHVWDNGKVTTEPTETTPGEKTFSCTLCDATKTEEIPAGTEPGPAVLPGDANEDGKVSLKDAVLVLQYTVDSSKTLNLANADVNGDGNVTLKDAVAILRMTL